METLTELYINPGNGVRVLLCRKASGHEVVIKEVERPSGVPEDVMDAEGRLAQALEHPNICKVHNCRTEARGDSRYLIIEMEKGDSDLAQEIAARTSPWTDEEIWNMLGQTVAGLSFAQSKQVCHRDIKPSNILIQSSGRVFLSDFGAAKLVNVTGFARHTLQGTQNYLSPELLKHYQQLLAGNQPGKPIHDPYRSDIYSLGLSFIEMICLRFPMGMRNLTRLSEVTDQTLSRLYCGEELKTLLGAMVEPGYEYRPDFLQLAQMIQVIRGYNLHSIVPLRSNCSFSSQRSISIKPALAAPTLRLTCDRCRCQLELQHVMLVCGHKFCLRMGCLESFEHSCCPVCHQQVSMSFQEICCECRKRTVSHRLAGCNHSFCTPCFRGWKLLGVRPKCSSCQKSLTPEEEQLLGSI